MNVQRPLALYVHMPWCVRKCPYCDFNSHRAPSVIPVDRYVAALLDDLDHDIAHFHLAGRELVSVFMGGGTPSLFSAEAIDRLLAGVRRRLSCTDDLEVTLEANPGTIERGVFRDYRAAGVNRVSLGVQSFSDSALERLGRIHRQREVFAAVDELHAASLENFNLDLMYALPEQTVAGALSDLETAIALQPAHLSHYELTLEPGTVFHSKPPPLPSADTAWEMQVRCQQRLADGGFEQYEVSAYAKQWRQCRHNLNYWRFGDYLGIGAGAHGKVTLDNAIVRTVREKQPVRYLSALVEARVDRVAVEDAAVAFEFMLNALRLREGFTAAAFEQATGRALASIGHQLAQAERRGLLECVDLRWRPTETGRRFLNDLQADFLPDAQDRSVAST